MRKRGFTMYVTREQSFYKGYKPQMKKYSTTEVKAYIGNRIATSLYGEIERYMLRIADGVVIDATKKRK